MLRTTPFESNLMTGFLPSTETIAALVKIGLLVGGLMTAAAYLVLVERWIAAWVQDRRGPNRVGIPLTKIRLFGLGQPLADGLKIILKEDFTPRHVDKVLYNVAPLTLLTASLAIFAAIPFGSVLPPLNIPGLPDPVPFLVAPGLDVGVLWVFALSSIAVYGVLLGGWLVARALGRVPLASSMAGSRTWHTSQPPVCVQGVCKARASGQGGFVRAPLQTIA